MIVQYALDEYNYYNNLIKPYNTLSIKLVYTIPTEIKLYNNNKKFAIVPA